MEIIKLFESKKIIAVAVILLIALTFATSYYGSVDTGDYADSAKYFAGEYNAKIRNSHSYLYGLIHAPFLEVYPSFLWFKISSLIFLFCIIYSVYFISGDRRSFLLILFSPAVWYMAPWTNPIQMASLCLLWAWFFIDKYQRERTRRNLIYSGMLIGLGWAIWNTILFFGSALVLCYIYDKKFYDFLLILFSIIVGLIPLIVLDHIMFGFGFYTIIKTTMSNFIATLFGGIYNSTGGDISTKIIRIVLILLIIPIGYWRLYKGDYIKSNFRTTTFLTLCLLIILVNPQLRYALSIIPIMIVISTKYLNEKQFKLQIIVSLLLILLFVYPYIVQIGNSYENEYFGKEISGVIADIGGQNISPEIIANSISIEIEEISSKYPNEKFIVGNAPDDYQLLAHYYWGDNVNEFISVQDYILYKENRTVIFEKTFMPVPRIEERRQIFIKGGISKNENDLTDYDNINYAISVGEPLEIEDFTLLEEYNILKVYKRN